MRNLLTIFIVAFISCNADKSPTLESKSFFKNSNISQDFQGVDSLKRINNQWMFFNSIGESEFLSNSDYDFYIIHTIQRWHEPLKYFSISSLNNSITYRKGELKSFNTKLSKTNEGDSIEWSADLASSTGSMNKLAVKPYQDIINFAVMSLNKDTSFYYDEDVSQMYYFDGNKYYYFSKNNLAPRSIDSINRVFRFDSLVNAN